MKKLTTYNLQLTTKKRGFTLLEILIASTLFAMVMIMTTGTIASSSSYQGKLKAMREAGEESRRIADLITSDVRSANTPLLIHTSGLDFNFKNGLALFHCAYTGTLYCSLNHYTDNYISDASGTFTDGDPFNTNALESNAIAISTKEGVKVYVNSLDNKTVHYHFFSGVNAIDNEDITGTRSNSADIINAISNGVPVNETAINFGGFCPHDESAGLIEAAFFQPYVRFFITSRTTDFNNLSKNQRASAQIKSIVTSRSYNQ